MKKLLSFSPSKVLVVCGLGLAMTLGAFWHYQSNQSHLNQMNILNHGVGTCFNRISQTFTAMMIKDIQSPYLNRGFMGLSDECLNETIKGINPFRQHVGKGHETLNKLISEVHWFHEKVLKLHAPMLAGQGTDTPLGQLSERFTKMEAFKVGLVDEIDAANARYTEIQSNDEVLMGVGLLMFVVGLSILSIQEFNRAQLRNEIEKNALNLLKAGQGNVGAMVDRLVEKALKTQGLHVTTQIFKDYHGDLLERFSYKFASETTLKEDNDVPAMMELPKAEFEGPRSSLKEILVSLQNVHSKEILNISDVRDVQLRAPFEASEQMLNAVVNKLSEKNHEKKKIMVSNQVHSDRSVINFFLSGYTFNAGELEYVHGPERADNNDMNMMIIKEMAREIGAIWNIENKTDRQGKIAGMTVRLTLKRVPKEKSKLVSVMKGKKKDLVRQLMN